MDYIKLLKDCNLKLTPQRLAIIEVLRANGHMSVDDLYQILLEKFPTISLATIYKNINAMQKKSFLEELKTPSQKNVYELRKKTHSHVVCSKCNHIMDIYVDTSSLLKQANSLSNYSLLEGSVLFTGICPTCR